MRERVKPGHQVCTANASSKSDGGTPEGARAPNLIAQTKATDIFKRFFRKVLND